MPKKTSSWKRNLSSFCRLFFPHTSHVRHLLVIGWRAISRFDYWWTRPIQFDEWFILVCDRSFFIFFIIDTSVYSLETFLVFLLVFFFSHHCHHAIDYCYIVYVIPTIQICSVFRWERRKIHDEPLFVSNHNWWKKRLSKAWFVFLTVMFYDISTFSSKSDRAMHLQPSMLRDFLSYVWLVSR